MLKKFVHQILSGNIRQTEVITYHMSFSQTWTETIGVKNNYFFITNAGSNRSRKSGRTTTDDGNIITFFHNLDRLYKKIIILKQVPLTVNSSLLSKTSQLIRKLMLILK
ncbi:hypothetical protein SDC9_102123 [bioreactor metagenome]|uniref:Uncharacterized protein n=1 Tax=bioreactor metagenome TaxID=1076179 RepID=A0A645AQH2_9ZZZZ